MIVCVAGNPSIDKLFQVERLSPGGIHRPQAFVQVPGGKGLNVARAVAALGANVIATGVLGGHTGRWVAEAMASEGVDARFAWTAAETRSSLSVADRVTGRLTEFYEDGQTIDGTAWLAMEAIVRDLLPEAGWITMSGSLPPGAPADGYARVVTVARAAGVACALDAQGEPLSLALPVGPNVVKVNAAEAAALLGDAVSSEGDALHAARRIVSASGGIGHAAVITRGAEGAVLVAPDGSAWAGRLYVRGAYPVGSGDSFLAGLVVALSSGDAWPDAMGLALGAGTANAEVPGAGRLDPDRARELAGRARVTRLDG
jgi:1-phosphofructokinase family hexose kinase